MNLELKPAIASDLLTVYSWANDPVTRQWSFSIEPITLEDHTKWFHKKIENEDCIYLLLWADNQPAGQIRFDKNGDEQIISFAVDSIFRGRGLGAKILNLGEEYLFEKIGIRPLKLKGFVKKENVASVISFEKNNYDKAIADEALHPHSFVFTKLRS
jgi:UDP-2,4-diacetamido-2,4,6-trideoxy-beta-L-altropyranose hydrolase